MRIRVYLYCKVLNFMRASENLYTVQVERVKSELTKRITELEITLQRERAARGVTAATNDKALQEARAKVLELTSQVCSCCPFTRCALLHPICTGLFVQLHKDSLASTCGVLFEYTKFVLNISFYF